MTLRANVISRYLGEKSSYTEIERSTKGRTPGSFSRGYEVKPWVDGKVRVDFTLGSGRGGSPKYQANVKMNGLEALIKVLQWDYEVEHHKSYLVVTKKKTGYVPELGPQAVSAHLGKKAKETGVSRSEYSTTRIKGWGRWTEGYEVKKTYLGITVDFNWSSAHHWSPGDSERRVAKMEAMKKALEEKYTVVYGTRGKDSQVLVVTKK